MIPVIINKINRAEFRKYYEQRRVMNRGESRTIKASPKIYWVHPSWCCLFMVLASRGPSMDGCPGGPAAQKTISCPGDQAQGHREGKSSKPLPFECNLNVAGGRAKFAAAARPGGDYHWHDTTVYNLRCTGMTERNASSARIWYGRRSLAGWHSDRDGSIFKFNSGFIYCLIQVYTRFGVGLHLV